ncbi:LOW QUALITY PROTEIN: leucine-rich repeat and transmembrane domain-containing protein 1 [Notamacropus eugenii]|uniref:LOW QUALITY PROTEIN: leucine-rich repeat and transmembrane domain-containing protein 1 n=1 Tax=Notamacropus eugenii TaxID=9315 RepID=UPI003B676C10
MVFRKLPSCLPLRVSKAKQRWIKRRKKKREKKRKLSDMTLAYSFFILNYMKYHKANFQGPAMTGDLLWFSSVLLLLSRVSSCPEKCLCHLPTKSVDCSRQGLREIPLELPPRTQILHLQHNHIGDIPTSAFSRTPLLRTLDLSHNALLTLAPGAFLGLAQLQVLNLTQNSLHSLESKVFQSLPQLQELDLSFNNIQELPKFKGETLSHLTRLAIQSNQLQQVHRAHLASLPRLRALFFKDNLWKCNCHLLDLKLWLESFVYKGGMTDGVICSSPDIWKGKDLLKIPYELYNACLPLLGNGEPIETQLPGTAQQDPSQPSHPQEHIDKSRSDCELKPKARPVNLRHAIATVVITGVVCGVVCLMMLAAAIYGCTYAAIMAKGHGEALSQVNESRRAGIKKGSLNTSLA